MNKKTLIIVGCLILLVLLVWAPWTTKGYAEKRVVEVFEESQRGIIDGCGFNCDGCGVKGSHKTVFGYSVTLEYACGFLPSDSKDYHRTSTKFVSFIGSVH